MGHPGLAHRETDLFLRHGMENAADVPALLSHETEDRVGGIGVSKDSRDFRHGHSFVAFVFWRTGPGQDNPFPRTMLLGPSDEVWIVLNPFSKQFVPESLGESVRTTLAHP